MRDRPAHGGPYVITTKRACSCTPSECESDGLLYHEVGCSVFSVPRSERTSRRAVGTLEEARYEAREAVAKWRPGLRRSDAQIAALHAAEALSAEGGSVGPLPDGTVIEVEPGPGQQQMRQHLREWGVSIDTRDALDDTIVFAWVTAYNAAQER